MYALVQEIQTQVWSRQSGISLPRIFVKPDRPLFWIRAIEHDAVSFHLGSLSMPSLEIVGDRKVQPMPNVVAQMLCQLFLDVVLDAEV